MKQFAEFCLDAANECLWRDGVRVVLPPKPFAVLRYLVENAGRLVTHDELLDAVWPETYVQPQVLRTYMLELRKALGDDAREPRFIQSLPKRGYCFIAEVTESGANGNRLARPLESLFPADGFIGREEEFASLAAHLRMARDGCRQVVFVCGEAGVGKSALLDSFCLALRSTSATLVGVGQCVQGFSERQDYYPVLDALGQLCARGGILGLLRQRAPGWVDEGGCASIAHALSSAERAPGDLCAALDELTQEQLLVLVIEDLQWADEATLDLIAAIARRRGPARLLILASAACQGESTPHRLRQMMHDLTRRRLATELTVARLCRPGVARLVRARLGGQEISVALLDLVHLRSEGNPLFAIAMVEHFIAEKMLVRRCDDGLWELRGAVEQIEASVPHELAQMIELEMEHLTAKERRLLEAGSLISVAFPAWAVAAALDEDLAETEEACDALARRFAFINRAGEDELPDGTRSAFYVFAHGLYREALYQRQSAARRALRHVRIAERLRKFFPDREDLVAWQVSMHYEAAGEWQRALDVLRAAEQSARRLQAHALAGELGERAERVATRLDRRHLATSGAELPAICASGADAKSPRPAENNLDDFLTKT